MPRAFDTVQYPANYDPTVSKLNWSTAGYAEDLAKAAAEALDNFVTWVLEALQHEFGFDFTPWIPMIHTGFANLERLFGDLAPATFNPVDAITTFINLMTSESGSLPLLPLALIPASIPDLIPLTSLGNTIPNLLPNGLFNSANSVDPASSGWSWTSSVFQAPAVGSAVATHNGQLLQLFSKPATKVLPGQVVSMSTAVQWANLPAGLVGSVFELGVQWLDSTQTAISTVSLANISNPAVTNTAWQTLSGNATAPANAAYARQVLTVNPLATAGTSWWSNSVLQKPNLPDIFKYLNASTGFLSAAGVSGVLDPTNIPNITKAMSTDLQTVSDYVAQAFQANPSLVNTTLQQAKDSMSQIYEQLANNTNHIQAIQSKQQQANTTGGANFLYNFSQYADGPLPSDFTVSYLGTGSSRVGISKGIATWTTKVWDANVTARVLHTTPLNSDYQVVRGTMNSAPQQNGNPRVWAIARADSATNPQNFVFARAWCNGWLSYVGEIGCVINGVETIWQTNIPLSWSMDMYLIAGVGTNPRQYQVYSGTKKVVDLVESPANSMLGSAYRIAGAFQELNAANQTTSGDVAGCNLYDDAPATVLGSGGRMTRTNTATVSPPNTSSGATYLLPTSFFDSLPEITPDITADLTNGKFTVSIEGWYTINSRTQFDGPMTVTWNPTGATSVLYKNGSPFQYGGAYSSFYYTGYDSGEYCWNANHVVYLRAGDYVQIGNHNYTAIGGFHWVGSLDGAQTYFSIARFVTG